MVKHLENTDNKKIKAIYNPGYYHVNCCLYFLPEGGREKELQRMSSGRLYSYKHKIGLLLYEIPTSQSLEFCFYA